MDIKKVKELLELVEKSEIEDLEIEIHGKGGTGMRVRKGRNASASQVVAGMPVQAPVPPSSPQVQAAAPQVREAPTPATTEPEATATTGLIEIVSPMVGTFYRAPSPDAEPYVKVGDHVEEGMVVCIVEAMKLMNEIQSEVSGTVKKILIEDAQPVEFGQVIFLIEPD